MIYVTHDQTEAMTMSDRIAVFSNGRLAQMGTPLDVYHRPTNRFVAEFVGDSNFFAGTIDAARPGQADLAAIGRVRVPPRNTLTGDVDIMIRPERLQPTHMVDAVDANEFEMTIDDTINYGDSIVVIGTTRGVPLRARLVSARPDLLRPGATLRLAWAPADAHVLPRQNL
jgi:putative spermidine/putrescine transport system ATP-binding protein